MDVEYTDISNYGFNKFQSLPSRKPGIRFGLSYFGGGDADTSIDDPNDAKALADVARAHLERYEDVGKKYEDQYIESATNYDTEERQAQMSGQASSAVTGAFGEAITGELKARALDGQGPNAGGFKTALNDGYLDQASAKSDNVNRTLQSIQDAEIQGKQNVVAMGRGQETEAIQGLNSMAIDSVKDAKDSAFRNYNSNSANQNAVGMGAGMVTRTAMGADDE